MRKAILYFVVCQLVLALLAICNDLLINTTNQKGIDEFESFQEKILLVLLFAPIVETLIFNLLLNEALMATIRRVPYCVFISSLIFGLIHYYSPSYMIFTFLAGIVFNSFYFWVREQSGYKMAVLGVCLLHFNHNLLGLLIGK